LRSVGAILLVVAATALLIGSAQGQHRARTYKWTDEKGVVHYGDAIPPEYANRDRTLLNEHGVEVGTEEGEITPEERQLLDEKEAAAERERKEKEDIARHDRMLLETYISVADIEELRDRRLELLASQIKLTEVYLGNQRGKLVGLEADASEFKPYSTREDAPQMPQNLAQDISQTAKSINSYEQTLANTRAKQEAVRVSFNADIARFRELKGR